MIKIISGLVLMVCAITGIACTNTSGAVRTTNYGTFERDDNFRTFELSDNVIVERVRFQNRFGIILVGDMYIPQNIDRSRQYAALVTGHPFGGVKEQTSGLYAMRMAEQGFITLAFDASFQGESGGVPRNIEAPEIRVEDFSAAVDFLSNHPLVNPNRIGVIGICGSGGYSVSATQIDQRIKALATVSMYDMGRARRQGLGDTITFEQRMNTLREVGEQRTREFAGGERRDITAVPQSITDDSSLFIREFYYYYQTPRGQHPHSNNGYYSFTSLAPMMNHFPFTQIETISPRPLLFIVGETDSAYFSEDAYNRAAEPKELYVIRGATHIDLYDRDEFMPIEKLANFFNQHLTN